MNTDRKLKNSKKALKETGIKHDQDKPRLDLIPPFPLVEMGKVFDFGAKKYNERNWEKGMKWGRLYRAALSHLFAFWDGEDIDESDIHHLAHAACNIIMLLEYTRLHREFDDRPERKK